MPYNTRTMPNTILNELFTGSSEVGKTRIAAPSKIYTKAINALKIGNKPFISFISVIIKFQGFRSFRILTDKVTY